MSKMINLPQESGFKKCKNTCPKKRSTTVILELWKRSKTRSSCVLELKFVQQRVLTRDRSFVMHARSCFYGISPALEEAQIDQGVTIRTYSIGLAEFVFVGSP